MLKLIHMSGRVRDAVRNGAARVVSAVDNFHQTLGLALIEREHRKFKTLERQLEALRNAGLANMRRRFEIRKAIRK